MTNEFKAAVRQNVGVFVGIAGGTGSGKTYSALRLARGLAGPDGKIAAGDTEGRRMSHYAEQFKFDVVDLVAPFRPEKFEQLAKDAEAKGYAVLVIDSFSHEWAGDGGVLEWHDEIKGDDEKKNMMAWIKPKQAHKGMVNSFLQRTIPIVFCMRAEEKVKVGAGGKPESQGWMPICDPRFAYELTVMLTLSNENPGRISYKLPRKIQEQHLAFFPDGQFITEESGQKLAAWAAGAAPVDRVSQGVDSLIDRIEREVSDNDKLEAILKEQQVSKQVTYLLSKRPDEHKRLFATVNALRAAFGKPAIV